VIVMCAPDLLGTAIEIGMAIAWGRPIWLVGQPDRDSVFFYLENVRRFKNELEVFDELLRLDPVMLERQPPAPIIIEP
jgi:hypothetical protein